MRTYLTLTLITLAFTTTTAVAQKVKRIPQTISVDNKGRATEPPVYKDEKGEILQPKQVMSYMQTGNYKMVKTIGKVGKEVVIVTKSPGYNRGPIANEIVVKPR